MSTIIATVRFLPTEEGGLQDHWFSGMMPSFNIDGNLIMCRLEAINETQLLRAGENHDLRIDIPQGDLVQDHLRPNATFCLNAGGRVVARGRITEVVSGSCSS